MSGKHTYRRLKKTEESEKKRTSFYSEIFENLTYDKKPSNRINFCINEDNQEGSNLANNPLSKTSYFSDFKNKPVKKSENNSFYVLPTKVNNYHVIAKKITLGSGFLSGQDLCLLDSQGNKKPIYVIELTVESIDDSVRDSFEMIPPFGSLGKKLPANVSIPSLSPELYWSKFNVKDIYIKNKPFDFFDRMNFDGKISRNIFPISDESIDTLMDSVPKSQIKKGTQVYFVLTKADSFSSYNPILKHGKK